MKKRLIGSLLFGALIMSSSSVFVSCADYDDDINANKAEIVAAQNEIAKLTSSLSELQNDLKATKAALESELENVKSTYNTALTNLKAELNAAIEKKADQTTVDNLSKEIVRVESDYKAEVSKLQSQINAIDVRLSAIEALIKEKADKSELVNLENILKALIDKKVDNETYLEAVARVKALEDKLADLGVTIAALQTEKASLDALNTKVEGVNKEIEALKVALNGKVSQAAFDALQKTVDGIQETLKDLQAQINAKASKEELANTKNELQNKIDALAKDIKDNYVTNDKLAAAIAEAKAALDKEITALQNSKADKAEVTAALERIVKLETQLFALQANVTDLQNNKAVKVAVAEAIANLKSQVESMLASKADKDVVMALQKDLEKLAELVDTKANTVDVEAADAELLKLIVELQATSATKQELAEAADNAAKALEAAVKGINETIELVKTDLQGQIDDAVKRLGKAEEDIAGALLTLATVQGDIDAIDKKYAGLIAELKEADTVLDGKIAALNGIIYNEDGGILNRLSVAEEALKTQNKALSDLSKALDDAKAQIAKDIENASKEAQDALKKEIDERQAAITEAMNAISDLEKKLSKQIEDKVKAATDRIKVNEDDIKALKEEVGKIDEKVNAAVGEKVNNLQVFVSRYLKSISLVPQLFVGGIEAIEFKTLEYFPVQPGTSGYVHAAKETSQYVDNGETKAYYRLNPSIVKRDDINEDGIEYLAAVAETRAYSSATVTPTTDCPVEFNGISAWNYKGKTGLVEVLLKKKEDFRNHSLNENLSLGTDVEESLTGAVGNGWIVALKVPRKANAENNIEAADIVSENQLVVERSIYPKIAELYLAQTNANRVSKTDPTWNTKKAVWKNDVKRNWNTVQASVDARTQKADYYTHHFADSTTIWRQFVDENDLVFYEVVYNTKLNVLDLVTGCTHNPAREQDTETECGLKNWKEHNKAADELTKDQLKAYGLTFRFAIAGQDKNPKVPYNDPKSNLVDNETDQQQFAAIDRVTGILSSKLPEGRTDNRACVGKEPIIRIMLVDTVKGKLVDERYMKVKWVELTKDPITLEEYTSEKPLVPCDTTYSDGIRWKWFIEKVYANIDADEKLKGISQSTFEQFYLAIDPTYEFDKNATTWDNGAKATFLSLLKTVDPIPNTAQPEGLQGLPTIGLTKNKQGDALIADWNLNYTQIANIYPFQSKTFHANIVFHSAAPTEYPDLILPWKFTITLPKLPEINGFYDNYWLNPETKDRLAHDVMGVQYNTRLYKQIAAGDVIPGYEYGVDQSRDASINNHAAMELYKAANNAVEEGTPYFVFYNNLMNAFTYEQGKNDQSLFIVKNLLGECSSWDMQFTWNGPDAILAGLTWKDNKWSGSASYKGTYPNAHNNVTAAANKIRIPNQSKEFAFNGKDGYPQFDGYRPASNTNSPALSKIGWKTAGAYKFETKTGAQALQMEWWGHKLADDNISVDIDQKKNTHEAWDANLDYNSAILYADHHNAANQALLNKLSEEFESDGRTPKRTHTKPIHIGIWGTINDYNIIPVYDYDIYLVEPLVINVHGGGNFEEGYVSGTAVRCEDAFVANDWRGYEVANKDAGNTEWTKYRRQLYKYYEIGDPEWETDDVRYGMKVENNSVVRNDAADKTKIWDGKNNGCMTAKQISNITNGNIVLSIEKKTSKVDGKDYLVFKNNGGSNVEEPIYCYVPVSVTYGFGKVSSLMQMRIYPKGQVPTGVTIFPFPDGDTSRMR